MAVRSQNLPPGQREISGFPVFGLNWFAKRMPRALAPISLGLTGDVQNPQTIDASGWAGLPRTDQHSDLHCVTTWSACDLHWEGTLFQDLHDLVQPNPLAQTVLLRGADGYEATLPLEDLLAHDVLIADSLDGQPLGLDHGGPLRLVAPAHYGYKSVKWLTEIRFCHDEREFRPPSIRLMGHPRGRVAHEERGGLPARFLRFLYRFFIPSTIRTFQKASRNRQERG